MIDLHRPQIGDHELAAMAGALRSGRLAQGPEVEAFESAYASMIGTNHAVAVANGTLALEIGLSAAGLGRGDEVILPSFTFVATANAVRRVGATPVFADIDPKTFCITAATVEPHLTPRTRAVVAVHLYGHPADMDALTVLCQDRAIHLIEDAAQGIGASWRGRPAGSLGRFAAFSFYATKNLTTGEGGMITTSDEGLARTARALRSHMPGASNGLMRPGTNARMTEVAAAIGRCQLTRLPTMQHQRAEVASQYDSQLPDYVATPYTAPDANHGYHLYTIRTLDRDTVARTLLEREVGSAVYYREPCHLRSEYRDPAVRLPNTEAAAAEVLSLPMRPDLTALELEAVIEAVRAAVPR